MTPLDVNEMPQALDSDEIDAFSAWEPIPTIALTRYRDQVVIHKSLTTGYLYFSPSFVDRYPKAVRQIVASELRALGWMKQDQNLVQASQWALQAGQNLSGQTAVLAVEQYAEIAQSDLLGTTSVAALPGRDLETDGRLFREFEFLKDLGKIPDTTDWEAVRGCFDLEFIDQILADAQEYQLGTYEYAASDE
jgi:NitT/TauT family transport system substrate-binding protein